MALPYIVAIGLSAGGMVPLQTFFEATPHDAVTYVILRHFLLTQRSRLQEILQPYTHLKVMEIAHNTVIEKNTVYICPSDMYVTLDASGFKLIPRNADEPYPNRTIDVFLKSLAWMKGSQTIAVLLSGEGTDGIEGISAIHEAGGLVMVQEPKSCEFSSMPEHAIQTGQVDQVLLPQDMPAVIAEHVDADLLIAV